VNRALRHPATATFLLALLLRVGFALFENARSGSTLEWPDEELHWQIARNLAEHGKFVTDDGRLAARMPLYPAFLSLFATLGPAGVPAARIAQAILSALVVPIGVWLARRAFGQRAAWLAGGLLALDPYATYFAARLLTEVPFTLVAVGLIAGAICDDETVRLADHDDRNHRPGRAPFVSVRCLADFRLLGVAAILLRQSAVPWVVAWLIVFWWFARNKLRAAFQAAGRVIFIVAFIFGAWGRPNLVALGDFAWFSTNGGVTLYDAQGPQADGSSNQAFLKEMPQLAGLGEVALDHELTRLAIEQMQRDPARVLRLAWIKFARMWNPLPNVAEYRAGAAAWAGAAYTVVVLILAIGTGLACLLRPTKRRARRLQIYLWLPVIVFTLLHCIYIGSVRYRVPLMPMLAISAAGIVARQPRHRRCITSAKSAPPPPA
jgi:4-amino-4-deoxy-L-arabinose transferase-like glycosyltransferase